MMMADKVFDPENRQAWLVRKGDPHVGELPDGEYMSKADYNALLALYREAKGKCPACGWSGGYHRNGCPNQAG